MGPSKKRGGFGGHNKRKQRHSGHTQLTKKQKKHIKDFGESHPIDDRDTGKVNYKKVADVPVIKTKQIEEESDTSDSENEVSHYQQLVSTILPKSSIISEDEEEIGAEETGYDVNGKDPDKSSEAVQKDFGDAQKSGSESEEESDEENNDYREENFESEEEYKREEDLLETDPFSLHFEKDLEDDFAETLCDARKWEKEEIKLPSLGKCVLTWPEEGTKLIPKHKEKDINKCHIKQTLCKQLTKSNSVDPKGSTGVFSSLQQSMFSIINNYQDLYYSEQSHKNGEEIRLVYCLHALNHVLKTRSRVIAHNSKIKSKKEDIPDDYRDQGLTRPKVLMILPFRESVLRVVKIMTDLLMPKDQSYVSNKKRLQKEYSCEEEVITGKKPEDFEAIFAGNIDDHFRIGLGVAKKSLKLYTDFYHSDIILASPLGLRTIIGADGEGERDFDFLSSIEVLIFDQMDIYLMQNWDHISHIMSHLHLQPKESHDVDFSRVRMWTLNGWSKFYRQTLIFSSLATPEINAVFNKHCHNYAGKLLVQKTATSGSICQIVTPLPQVFSRIESGSYKELADARFEYFIKKVLPQHKDPVMSRTMIFVPSYFDFVRLRNYFKAEELDSCTINEYSKDKSISRSRTFFFHGKVHFMLYTERFHFYRRYHIRGIKHLIFYQLPSYPHFYSEMCNMLQDPKKKMEAENLTCSVIYSKFDAQRLAGVVGTERAAHMLSSEKSTHMFVTGEKT